MTTFSALLNSPDLFREQGLIGGSWQDALSGERREVFNPASQERLGLYPYMGEAETRQAIEAAESAFASFRHSSAKTRGEILERWADLLIANTDDLALILTSEQGKPLAEARAEIAISADYLRWFAGEGRRAYGRTIPSPLATRRLLTVKQPIGVTAHVTPWNFPMSMAARKLAPAIAAGCTAVLKPSELTPYSAFAFAYLGEKAGLPAGVVNLVTGDAVSIGQALCAAEAVRKLSFTGSTEVGRILYRQSAATIKKLSLELGGNAPFIVFDDADIQAAAEGAFAAKFRNSGQTCVAANRILVQASVHDAFAEALAAKMATLKLGAGNDPGVTQGPLINQAAVEKVEAQIADAVAKGARVESGGTRLAAQSNFFTPTVVANATPAMRFFSEETFGPLAPLIRFDEEAEAIRLANDSIYGLAAFFYSRDVGRCWRVAEALDYGQVGINAGVITTVEAPFGGVKQSGLGREGAAEGLEDYLETKYIAFDGLGSPS